MSEAERPAAPAAGGKRRTIRIFAAASFLNDLGSDIIYPVWPLFVTQVLRANMAALGLLDGLGEAVVSLSQAASGYLSDRLRRRKIFIWTGYLMGGLSRLGYAASSAWPHLIPVRVLDRAGKIRSAPRDALIADVSADGDRGRNFGLMRAMDNLGAVCGILISIALFNLLGYRLLFALAALPSIAGAALILGAIRERRDAGTRAFKGLSFRDIDRNLRLYIVLNGVFALGAFSYSFLLIYAHTAGFRTGTIPVLYLVFALSAAAFSIPMGRWADRSGRKTVLFAAFAVWAAVCAIAVAGGARLLVAGLFVLFGIHKAALEPIQKTLAAELAPLPFRASILGGFQMVVGLAALPASVIAGALWDRFGPAAPFAWSLALTAAAAGLLVFVREHRRTGPEQA